MQNIRNAVEAMRDFYEAKDKDHLWPIIEFYYQGALEDLGKTKAQRQLHWALREEFGGGITMRLPSHVAKDMRYLYKHVKPQKVNHETPNNT